MPTVVDVITRLHNGELMRVRPIRNADKRALSDGLRHLSAETIHKRFLAAKPRFSSSELRYLTEVDGWDHVALVAECPTNPVRRLLAVARYVRLPSDSRAAEVAVVVADDLHGLGLGSLMVEELGRRARMRGICRFTATMASDNVPAQRLFARLSRHVDRHHAGSGVDELVADLAA